MATEVIVRSYERVTGLRTQDFTWLQRLTLRLFHPRAVFIEMAGLIWSVYFLWTDDWRLALGTYIGTIAIALLAVSDTDPVKISKTVMGRLALLHLRPTNLVLRTGGFMFLIYGLWQHLPEFILTGLSVILLGHVFGWSQVHRAFANVNSAERRELRHW